MFKINGRNIEMTSGDFAIMSVVLDQRELLDDDELVMTIKRKVCDKEPVVLVKTTVDGKFIFETEDTKDMCGRYYYDIVLNTGIGERYTLIPPTAFEVKKGVADFE